VFDHSWEASGKSNTWDPTDLSLVKDDELGSLITQSLADTKGLIKLPVCSFEELINYLNENPGMLDEENGNYPCPP